MRRIIEEEHSDRDEAYDDGEDRPYDGDGEEDWPLRKLLDCDLYELPTTVPVTAGVKPLVKRDGPTSSLLRSVQRLRTYGTSRAILPMGMCNLTVGAQVPRLYRVAD